MGLMLRALALAVMLVAPAAAAQCQRVSDCWCGVSTEALYATTLSLDADGGVTVKTEDGRTLSGFARFPLEDAGARNLLIDGVRWQVELDGYVTCEPQRVPAGVVRLAVNSGSLCTAVLADAGFVFAQPPCNDNRGCTVSNETGGPPTGLIGAVALALFLVLRVKR